MNHIKSPDYIVCNVQICNIGDIVCAMTIKSIEIGHDLSLLIPNYTLFLQAIEWTL